MGTSGLGLPGGVGLGGGTGCTFDAMEVTVDP